MKPGRGILDSNTYFFPWWSDISKRQIWPSPLPFLLLLWRASMPQKSRLTSSGLFCYSSNKTLISSQNKRKFRKDRRGTFIKVAHLVSTYKNWVKGVKSSTCGTMLYSSSRLMIKHCGSNSQSYQDDVCGKHWLPQTCSTLQNCLPTWTSRVWSILYSYPIDPGKNQKTKRRFPTSCTSLKHIHSYSFQEESPLLAFTTTGQEKCKGWAQPI